jgi:UDP-N-acetylglucosamine 2-epimerase (non-hydrolysing)
MNSSIPSTGPILCVVGARPNSMKRAPLLRAQRSRRELPPAILLHTGQHYDPRLKDQVYEDLCLPMPEIDLQVGSGTHAAQTADVMKEFEPVLDRVRPSCVIVVGDVNSTLACSVVAVKKQIPVAHVEAGLRSFDRTLPEENADCLRHCAPWCIHREPPYVDVAAPSSLARSQQAQDGSVLLPLFASVTSAEVRSVSQALAEACRR